jgi:hypothetical protein
VGRSKRKGQPRTGVCAYCGKHGEISRDHVIPKCLFAGPLPSEGVPVVPACRVCNGNVKGRADTYLRDMLASDFAVMHNPVAQRALASFINSLDTNKSVLPRELNWQAQPVQLYSPQGIYLGTGYGATLPKGRAEATLAPLVCGLVRFYTGSTLPTTTWFEVRKWYDWTKLDALFRQLAALGGQLGVVGDGDVFQCVYLLDPAEPGPGIWLLSFYKSIFFTVVTTPANWRRTRRVHSA